MCVCEVGYWTRKGLGLRKLQLAGPTPPSLYFVLLGLIKRYLVSALVNVHVFVELVIARKKLKFEVSVCIC